MDLENVFLKIVALNRHIVNSLVKKGSLLNEQGTELAKLINVGKMIYDANQGIEKPDVHWVKAILEMQNIKDTQGVDILKFYLSDISKETKPLKFEQFIQIWKAWSGDEDGLLEDVTFDDKIASWKPHRISLDEWVENTGNTNLQDWIEENSKYFDDEEQSLEIPDESAESMVNSHPDAHIWHHLKKDKSNSEDSTFANKNILDLLKVAKYIEDRNDTTKSKLIRLIESHIQHIIGLVNRGNIPQAKEYLKVIRPRGWENNAERNVDKFYEQVIRGLSEKLEPEAFQALGL